MRHTILILLFFISVRIYAQDVTAWLDYRGYLQVFDKGVFRQLEYLPVTNYKIGGAAVAYIDHKNDFKIYYNGQSTSLVNAADFSYFATDYLVAFRVGNVLYAFEDGQKKTLCYYTSIMTVNDSVLAYFDDAQSSLNIYYNGKIAEAENSFLDKPKSIKTGSNIVAWVNQSNYFTLFYHGRSMLLDNLAPRSYEAGRDIVAWVDDYEQRFHLFYKGDTAMIEQFAPDSFKVGFGIMAYVDQTGNFRVFNNGSTKRLLSGRPDLFEVKGNCVLYYYNNMFNVYYNDKVYTLQNVIPSSFKAGNNGVAWLDDSGRLNLFDKGKTYVVSYEIINDYFLNGNVLKYNVGTNTVKIFYEGKNY
jgi:hypothetical protein